MKYFLDTNIFIRFLVPDDRNLRPFQESSALFKAMNSGTHATITSSLVIAELIWVMQKYYGAHKEDLLPSIKTFLANGIAIEDRADVSSALNVYASHNVKLIDCIIATHPEIQNGVVQLISYDKDFDKLGVKRIEPKEATNQ